MSKTPKGENLTYPSESSQLISHLTQSKLFTNES